MTDLEFTKEDAREAFYNLGKLGARLSSDEGKRLFMLTQVIASYMTQLEERPAVNKQDGLVCAKCYKRIGKDEPNND